MMHVLPLVQVFDPASRTYQYLPLPQVCETFRAQGRYWELESLLATSAGAYTPEDRRSIFMWALRSYADAGLYDKALQLSAQLQSEGLAADFPQFHTLMAQLGESYSIMTSVVASAMPSASTSTFPSAAPSTATPTPLARSAETSRTVTPVPQLEPPANRVRKEAPISRSAGVFAAQQHKNLKRALAEKNVDEAHKAYKELDRLVDFHI